MFLIGDIENAVMIIVNALYFKGFWNEEFRKNETKYGGFYKTPDEVINVQYMKNTAKYHYVESKQLDASILRIPYKVQYFYPYHRFNVYVTLFVFFFLFRTRNIHFSFYYLKPKPV